MNKTTKIRPKSSTTYNGAFDVSIRPSRVRFKV